MRYIGDLHIHSHFSLATGRQSVPEYLDYYARLKGITVVGTGDFTHPGWVAELREKLEPAEQGLFRLKNEFAVNQPLPGARFGEQPVRFMLTAEISSIYKKRGKVRKVHNVLFAPDFDTVEKIQRSLTARGGNITSDGRPILGIDSRDLLEIALNASDRILFVPAHIWTPWFSALGSKSGFDTIDECYDDLAGHIHAVETGLSSDPPMNRRCGFLDKYTLVSNSDAHSPGKLGREANIFDTDLSYDAMRAAIIDGNSERFIGTIEFFPQEGKYHYDGHRACGIRWDPCETRRRGEICPVCNKPVTVGVLNRVIGLSGREAPKPPAKGPAFYSVIPLREMLGEVCRTGPESKKVGAAYAALLEKLGPELDILLSSPVEEIGRAGGPELAEAIRRMRNREVVITEGFDGEYGRIRVFPEGEFGGASARGHHHHWRQ